MRPVPSAFSSASSSANALSAASASVTGSGGGSSGRVGASGEEVLEEGGAAKEEEAREAEGSEGIMGGVVIDEDVLKGPRGEDPEAELAALLLLLERGMPVPTSKKNGDEACCCERVRETTAAVCRTVRVSFVGAAG